MVSILKSRDRLVNYTNIYKKNLILNNNKIKLFYGKLFRYGLSIL
jgi:hypothetical protein